MGWIMNQNLGYDHLCSRLKKRYDAATLAVKHNVREFFFNYEKNYKNI